MTRVEYIQQLEFSLSGKLPRREISEILRDYSEYFEAGKSEGKTEEEIAISLGIPSAAAGQILLEIKEEAGYKKKMPEPEQKKDKRFWEGWWERLKALFEQLSEFFSRLFGGIKLGTPPAATLSRPEDSDAQPAAAPPVIKPVAVKKPENASPPPPRDKRPKKAKTGSQKTQTLLSILLGILLLPFIGMVFLFGISLLGVLCVGIACLIIFMLLLFLFFLTAALAGSIGFSIAGGLGLPLSFTILFILGLLFCLSGSILSICGLSYLIKGLARLIRFCFSSTRWRYEAQPPTRCTQSPNVYQDGWNAPTPPPSCTPPEEPPLSAYDSSSYTPIYEQPVPEPHLQFGNEQPEKTGENREEIGHA